MKESVQKQCHYRASDFAIQRRESRGIPIVTLWSPGLHYTVIPKAHASPAPQKHHFLISGGTVWHKKYYNSVSGSVIWFIPYFLMQDHSRWLTPGTRRTYLPEVERYFRWLEDEHNIQAEVSFIYLSMVTWLIWPLVAFRTAASGLGSSVGSPLPNVFRNKAKSWKISSKKDRV